MIRYRISRRKQNSSLTKAHQCAHVVLSGTTDLSDLCRRTSESTSVAQIEVKLIAYELLENIKADLIAGKSVHLDGFMILAPSVKTQQGATRCSGVNIIRLAKAFLTGLSQAPIQEIK